MHKIIFERRRGSQLSLKTKLAIYRVMFRDYYKAGGLDISFRFWKDHADDEFWVYAFADRLPPRRRPRQRSRAQKLSRPARLSVPRS